MLNILTIHDEENSNLLNKICEPINEYEAITLNYMFKEMKSILKPKNFGSENHNGLGLALPQVGILKRGFVFRCGDHYEIAINPKILDNKKKSNKKILSSEGCLSIPDEWYLVERNIEIDVVYRDINFNLKTVHLVGITAKVFQHELDHLDGKLINDIGSKIILKDESVLKEIAANLENEE
jgi:peptide deformylase